ncbi:helix-turn-helix domain-containing protein [Bifidobacterium sp. 82T10]|uniref:Helix-turn-helix domain-containing protein n=1 Tax=Bifidobacterium miconis TaxID=2834435 RepID=A0ABS6WEA8_9BIFI|nr:helix-turn-helix domain-containing protein [Bifidobacterium miconis]MBW3092394.1 helix-turn-helix domain-containing protein [Bifidobacterium miconis]
MNRNNEEEQYASATAHTSMKRLEPLKEAAESLGIKDTRVIKRLIRENKLKAIKIGNRIYITTKSLDKFVG